MLTALLIVIAVLIAALGYEIHLLRMVLIRASDLNLSSQSKTREVVEDQIATLRPDTKWQSLD